MLTMILAIIMAIVLFVLVFAICVAFEETTLIRVISKVVVMPAFATLVYYYAPKTSSVLAMTMLAGLIITMLYMVLWWAWEGSSVKEFVLFFLTDLLLCLIATETAVRVIDLTSIRVVVGLVRAIPTVVFIISIGYFIADMVWFHKGLKSDDFDPYEYLDEDEVGGE